jgi:hypothetical protein
MDLGAFELPLRNLLRSRRPLVERLERALKEFPPIEEGSAVLLLDWLDMLGEPGPLDRRDEEPPDGWSLPPDFLKGYLAPVLERARQRARERKARRGQSLPPSPGPFLGRSRLLVVMEDGDAGACVWLTVTAFRPEGQNAELALADWSFFAVAEDEDFRQLRENLRPALRTLLGDDAEEWAAVERTSFLVELSPLRPGDLDPDWGSRSPEARERLLLKTWELAPSLLEPHGPSLGLPLGLAAAAARCGRSACSVLATGTLDRSGRVSSVGGLAGKAQAIRNLRAHPAALRRHRYCLVPECNRDTVLDDHLRDVPLDNVQGVCCLADGVKFSHFTDGFDDFRSYLFRLSEPRPAAADPWRQAGYEPRDAEAIVAREREWLEWLASWLRGAARPEPPTGRLCLLPVPFGADPTALAQHLERELSGVLAEVAGGLHAADLPVVVRARLSELFDLEQPCVEDVPKNLLKLIHERSAPDACEGLHVGNALATKGKIILVLHDVGSRALWAKENELVSVPNSPRFRITGILNNLALGARPDWEPQVVVLVCSDLHHQAAVRDVLLPQRPA